MQPYGGLGMSDLWSVLDEFHFSSWHRDCEQHLFSHGGFGQALGIGINKSNRDEQTEREIQKSNWDQTTSKL